MSNKVDKFLKTTHNSSMEKKDIDRFWDKVTIRGEDECWEWTAGKVREYGKIRINGKYVYAHRVSAHIVGKLDNLDDKKIVCHKCDNPGCVNPTHLFVGTHKDNTRDCMKKGRFVSNAKRGEQNHSSKLTEEDIIEIRRLHDKEGLSQRKIASLLGVHYTTIGDIVTGKTWRHVRDL